MRLAVIKKTMLAVLCLLMIFAAASCVEEAETGAYYMTDSDITTTDPQLVSTKAELSFAYACYDRLYTFDKNGKLTNGRQVSDVKVSSDEKTYTFTLSDGFYWSDGETPVTAEDYAFGIKRALQSLTEAPYAGLLSSIRSVSADKNRLTINLSTADKVIKYALSHPVSAPCNSKFFNSTKGKYGLSKDTIITNGAFHIYSWDTDEGIMSLRRSSADKTAGNPSLSYARIYYGADNNELIASAKEDTYNIYSSDSDVFREYTVGKAGKIDSFETTYCLYASDNMNKSNIDIAAMLIYDIDRDSLSINLPDYCRSAESIVPSDLLSEETAYSKSHKALNLAGYNKENAVKLRGDDKKTFDYLSKITLYYPDFSAAKTYASLITQTWQRDLNAYINPVAYKESDLSSILNTDEDTPVLAIIPIKSNDSTADGAVKYLMDIGLINQSVKTDADITAVQQSLVNSNRLYPLFEASYRFFTDEKITAVSLIPYSGVIDFRYITKAN